MRIHHLNCGTLRPAGGRMVCHCLLVETADRLVLVDSGFGTEDLARMWLHAALGSPAQLVRRAYATLITRAALEAEETAARQIARFGHTPADVTDVVLTHLDSDHAGGLPDFPGACVHVDRAERDFALSSRRLVPTSVHRLRYWPYQWAHGPRWEAYGEEGGEPWFGLDGGRSLEGLPDFVLVPLGGHSPGQCGVAIRRGSSWLLHAADAYFDHREIDPVRPRSPRGVEPFQRIFEYDGAARRETQRRLRKLVSAHGEHVEIFCSHDAAEFDRQLHGPSTAP